MDNSYYFAVTHVWLFDSKLSCNLVLKIVLATLFGSSPVIDVVNIYLFGLSGGRLVVLCSTVFADSRFEQVQRSGHALCCLCHRQFKEGELLWLNSDLVVCILHSVCFTVQIGTSNFLFFFSCWSVFVAVVYLI